MLPEEILNKMTVAANKSDKKEPRRMYAEAAETARYNISKYSKTIIVTATVEKLQ